MPSPSSITRSSVHSALRITSTATWPEPEHPCSLFQTDADPVAVDLDQRKRS